jgi:phosphoribosyl 1,2-cyclic phosphodiesterase
MARIKKPDTPYQTPSLFDSSSFETPTFVGEAPKAVVEPTPQPKLQPKEHQQLKFISFGSGSSGNCAYLGDNRFGILIDAGIDPQRIANELLHWGIAPESIGGVILTHDHGDHVRYAYSIVRKYRHMRIYCTPKMLGGILRRHNISRRINDYHQPIWVEHPFHIGNFNITPFEVSHDGTDNVGFSIVGAGQRFVVAPDMGYVTERADYYIRQANHLTIECNYDREMLDNGTYPEYLKARIRNEKGHMDNVATAKYLAEIITPTLHTIFLNHLSHDNNTPEIALKTVRGALEAKGIKVGDGSNSIDDRAADVRLSALPRFDSTGVVILRMN